jgi:Ni,Fe-hydrogenase I cytochrome b subunit
MIHEPPRVGEGNGGSNWPERSHPVTSNGHKPINNLRVYHQIHLTFTMISTTLLLYSNGETYEITDRVSGETDFVHRRVSCDAEIADR